MGFYDTTTSLKTNSGILSTIIIVIIFLNILLNLVVCSLLAHSLHVKYFALPHVAPGNDIRNTFIAEHTLCMFIFLVKVQIA